MVTTSFMKILNFFEFVWNFEILKFCENFVKILNIKIFIFFILKFWNFFWKFWNFMKFYENWNFWKFRNFEFFFKSFFFEILNFFFGFLDSDRGSRITITVVCPISDVQLKIPRKLFKLPVQRQSIVLKTMDRSIVSVLKMWNNSIFISLKKL